MKRMILAMATASVLAACGGGGGDDGGQQPVQAQQLGSYIGTWVADCDGRVQETANITRASNDALKIAVRTDYYTGEGCTGAVAATATHSADATATYVGTSDASVVIPPATTASTVKVDRVTATIGPGNLIVTGPAVTSRTNASGQKEWCLADGTATPQCIADPGTQPGSSVTSYFTISGNQLVELTPSGSTYVVDERLTRKP
jgi:hypothetical protein